MALPQQIDPATPAGTQDLSLGDDRIRELKRALCDILGIPDATNINTALGVFVAGGLQTLSVQRDLNLADAASDPAAAGQIRRNGSKLLWHNGERVVELQAAGEMKFYGGATVPAGWLLCDGSAVSRTTYARLFAAIGTAFGAGDGSTTFNLPPKGRVLVGRDAAQTEFDTLGETGGQKSTSLSFTGNALGNVAPSMAIDSAASPPAGTAYIEIEGGTDRLRVSTSGSFTGPTTSPILRALQPFSPGTPAGTVNGSPVGMPPYVVANLIIST